MNQPGDRTLADAVAATRRPSSIRARLSSIRIDALRYNSTTEAAKKRYGSNKPRAPECYGCNSMSMN
jgi:hypothetical protein